MVALDDFPRVDLSGVKGQWSAGDIVLESDGTHSVCLRSPVGAACNETGVPSFGLLQIFWSQPFGTAEPASRNFAAATDSRFTGVTIKNAAGTLCATGRVPLDGVDFSMFSCTIPFSTALEGIEVSYSEAGGVSWVVADDSASTPTTVPTEAPENYVVVAPNRRVYFPCDDGAVLPVVLLSGLGNDSLVWMDVLRILKHEHPGSNPCVFDRAGLGLSDPPSENVNAHDAVNDLAQALEQRSIDSPVLLVGASYGGLVAQLFARLHPNKVAGVVLVDATHPHLDAEIEKLLPPSIARERREELAGGPERLSYDDLLASDAAVEAAPPFPSVPLVVLRHGIPFASSHPDFPSASVEALWSTLEGELATMSACSDERIAENSGHRIHQDQPELVVAAIIDVLRSTSEHRCRL